METERLNNRVDYKKLRILVKTYLKKKKRIDKRVEDKIIYLR